jgi:ketosteroid isomerase-like protein
MEQGCSHHTISKAEELAHAFLRAIQAKDKEAILSLLADGFALEVPYNVSGTNDLSDSWYGLEVAGVNFEKTWKTIDVVKYSEIEVTAARDSNVAFAETLGDMTMASGRPYRNRYVFRFDIEGEKIKRIREYANPVTSMAAYGFPLATPDAS